MSKPTLIDEKGPSLGGAVVIVAGSLVVVVAVFWFLLYGPPPPRAEWGVSCSEPSVERSFVNENLEPRVIVGTTGDGIEGPHYVIPAAKGGVRITLCVDPNITWEMRPHE